MIQEPLRRTIPVLEISKRLGVCETMVYGMLGRGEIPALRPGGRKWIISRTRYEQWEASFGGGKAA